MDNHKLLSYIVVRINLLSKFYFADIETKPKVYFSLLCGRLFPSLKKGISIDRDEDAEFLPTKAFVFEPEIISYVTKMSHHDSAFAERLHAMELNSDDIETMFRYLTHNRLKLYMKGRKNFDICDDDE